MDWLLQIPVTTFITKWIWLHYKVLTNVLPKVYWLTTSVYKISRQSVIISLQKFPDCSKSVQISLQRFVTSLKLLTNVIQKVYWLHYKWSNVITKFIDFTTKCLQFHYKVFIISLQRVLTAIQMLQNFIKIYCLHYKVVQCLTKFTDFTQHIVINSPICRCYLGGVAIKWHLLSHLAVSVHHRPNKCPSTIMRK